MASDALTPAVLDALAEAEATASPGPWRATYADHVDGWCIENDADHVVAEIGTLTDARGDAALIALLRTHAPALIAAARLALDLEWVVCAHCTPSAASGYVCPWCSGHKPNHEAGCVRAVLAGEQGE